MQCFVTRNVPRTFMLCIKSKRFASVCSVLVNEMAEALFIKISKPPKVSIVFSMADCICSSNRMSTCTGRAFPPAASISFAAEKIVPPSFGFSSTLFAAITILAPSAANFNAIAFPMPRLAPVMRIVLLFKFIIFLISGFVNGRIKGLF